MFDKILIRFGELSLKGKNKMEFVNMLAKNIRQICLIDFKDMEINIDRIFIPYSEHNIKQLQYVFGISSYSPVLKIDTNLSTIENFVSNLDTKNSSTFKINARRKWKDFEMNSMELNHHLGSIILKTNKNLSVKVKNPDIEINLEIHKEYTYVFWTRIDGLGGLPAGSSGKALHLLSGGIDSPVAALKLIKRGVQLEFLSFISPPHTDETTVKKLMMIVEELTKYQIKSKLYLFKYTDLMNYIGLISKQEYKIVLMRRSFYRIATKIAHKNNAIAISNGENLGQVASQTMEAMNVIHNQTNLPIYQPLLTNDKLETIKESEKFNLFQISTIKACETCELFAPKHPSTKPKNEVAQDLEIELNMLTELEDKSIENDVDIHWFSINKK